MPKMITYRNIGGLFVDGDGVHHPHGTVFESADPDLRKKFANKFEVVHPEPDVFKSKPKHKAKAESGAKALAKVEPRDVTAEFPVAINNALLVFKDERGWWVRDGNDPVNSEPLPKEEVVKAIADYLGD